MYSRFYSLLHSHPTHFDFYCNSMSAGLFSFGVFFLSLLPPRGWALLHIDFRCLANVSDVRMSECELVIFYFNFAAFYSVNCCYLIVHINQLHAIHLMVFLLFRFLFSLLLCLSCFMPRFLFFFLEVKCKLRHESKQKSTKKLIYCVFSISSEMD